MEIKMDATASIPLIVGLTAVKLFAQTNSPMGLDASLMGLVGNLGIMGVLVWNLWYHTTKTYPNLLAQYALEQEKERTSNEREQERLRLAHEREQERLRLAHKDEQAQLRAANERERRDNQEHCAQEIANLRDMLLQVMTSARVAVHDVRDVAQQSINQLTLEKMKAVKNQAENPGNGG